MIHVNLTEEEGSNLAFLFGYTISSFPITYLDIFLYWKFCLWMIEICWWEIDNKLQGWSWKLLSMSSKVILLNSVLTYISIYWIFFYKLSIQIKTWIDQLRRRFL
jgi:hypothetical protein